MNPLKNVTVAAYTALFKNGAENPHILVTALILANNDPEIKQNKSHTKCGSFLL
jgi:hypothetical protein